MIQYDCYFMGKSAYAPCGQAASVGVPVGCVRIAKVALRSCTCAVLPSENVRKVYLYDKKDSIITKMNLGEKGDFESKSAIKNVIIQIDD